MLGQFAETVFTDFIDNMTPFKRASLCTPIEPPMQFNAEKIAAIKAENDDAKIAITGYEHMQKIGELIMSIDG